MNTGIGPTGKKIENTCVCRIFQVDSNLSSIYIFYIFLLVFIVNTVSILWHGTSVFTLGFEPGIIKLDQL